MVSPEGSGRRLGIACLTISLFTVGWTVVLAAPPARADCPILDPICVIEEAVDPVTDVVDPIVEDVIDEIVDPTLAGIDGVGEAVENAVAPDEGSPVSIDGPAAAVEDPDTGGGSEPPSPPTAPSDPTDPVSPGDPGSDPDSAHGSSIGGADINATWGGGPTGTSIGLSLLETSSSGVPALSGRVTIRPGFIDRFSEVIGSAAKALAFPIELAILVAAFLLVQHRIDRRDPRLALAPVRPGVLRFD